HANGARRRSGARESVSGSPRGKAPRIRIRGLMNRKISFIVAGFACAYVALSAQALPAGVQKGPSMGGITQYGFPNGLTVLLYPDAAEPKITINVTYLVGSRHEGYGETGMAHLLEHMDFIETTNGRKIKDEI